MSGEHVAVTLDEALRDDLRDAVSGIQIGSGYYALTIGIDDAREVADAVLAVLREQGTAVVEPACPSCGDGPATCSGCGAHHDSWEWTTRQPTPSREGTT